MTLRAALPGLAAGCFLFLLTFGQLSAQSPPASQSPAPFVFTKVDLQLLDLARQLDKVLEDKGQVFHDAKSAAYINAVGNRLAPPEPAPENVTWNYRILRDPIPNAFALPNGSIYVNTGLLGLLENEAQLAAVLGHEQTHVLRRHSYLEYRSYRKKMVGIHVLEAIASAGSVIGGVAGTSVYAAADVAPIFVIYTVFGYSRELEKDADVRGLTAMTNAGYSGEEMSAAFRLLDTGPEVHLESEPRFYADHPKLRDRIAYTEELLKSVHAKSDHPEIGAESYAAGTEAAVRHDVGLQILAGRPRSAVWEAQRLVKLDPPSSENLDLLGDAYRALGPRTPLPEPSELESDAKAHTRKMLRKMTLQEYEAALKTQPGGPAECQANDQEAEKSYKQALTLDPDCSKCYRGLGLLYQAMSRNDLAVRAFKKYLELAPSASDGLQISRHIEMLEQASSAQKRQGEP